MHVNGIMDPTTPTLFCLTKILQFAMISVTVLGTGTNNNSNNVPGEPFSPTEFMEAEKIIPHLSVPDNNTIDPIEKAGLFEGDVILKPEDKKNGGKAATSNPSGKWPDAVVPYVISSSFNQDERLTIARAMKEFERRTCLQFRPRRKDDDHDYIFITKSRGCSSFVGRTGGQQEVTLGEGCIYVGIAMHELNHAIGMWHEQNRRDRDDHVTIHYENIQPGAEDNFRKAEEGEAQTLGAPYDISSIMHYGEYAFTRSKGKKTISPKVQNQHGMGQRANFTETDVLKINKLYNCKKSGRNGTSPSSPESDQGSSTTQRPPTGDGNCVDNHKDCQYWADNGECRKNPTWMTANCKKSCSQCRPCTNENKHCDYWAEAGECSKNPEYMDKNCAKACKKC